MPPRRRREADAVLVSSGMRNPPRRERGFRYGRRHLGSPPDVGLSRDGVQGAPRPARQRVSGLQPALPVAPATRVPEALREGRHLTVRGRCQSLLRRVGPRSAWPTQVGRGVLTHAELVVARRHRSAATRGGGRRNRQWLLSASSGAPKAPLACEDRGARGCARASISGCRSRRATPRLREAHFRRQREAWTGAWPAKARKGLRG